MRMLRLFAGCAALAACSPVFAADAKKEEAEAFKACTQAVVEGLRKIAPTRDVRFEGKVSEAVALCRGGYQAMQFRNTPWVDWSNYWGAGDSTSIPPILLKKVPSLRGVLGALMDLEYQRIELIKFNLFDNNGTYSEFVQGRDGIGGPALKRWDSMRLASDDPNYQDVGGDGRQVCRGGLIRFRNLTGVCNDVFNPAMGGSGQLFARNMEFDTTFPDAGRNPLVVNRHGDRLGLLKPDPQLISRVLFTRPQLNPDGCREGQGEHCDYQKATFFNVLAAYWIQFMTHDWFSHMEEGHNNDAQWMTVGCDSAQAQRLGCRPGDRIDKGYVAQDSAPATFTKDGKEYLTRAPKTYRNTTTAWWDASQLYGYDPVSRKRVKRDPKDPAKFLLTSADGKGTLPVFDDGDPINPQWKGQEAAGFADNWTIGMSFLHNVFVREHNAFVDAFEAEARLHPANDSGLRNPADPRKVIRNRDVTSDELFEVARLVVSAEIAKIHTIEWTPQLLYNEPLYKGMNANWNGLLGAGGGELSKILSDIVVKSFGKSKDGAKSTQWYSVFASGPGIFGLGSKIDGYDVSKPEHVNGGVNHFGSPFNFPEEFVTVYRLHTLLPDVLDYRNVTAPNQIAAEVPIISTFEGKATDAMRSRGIANWAVTLGRQRLGVLTLNNHPRFMQNIAMPRLQSDTGKIDLAALDLIRDREHGVPRFNEFRRQYGLRQLTSFDDFMDKHVAPDSPAGKSQREMVANLRSIYGTHVCDASKQITDAQLDDNGKPIDDCLGHPNGSTIDNIEDVDTVVGWLAEQTRPHGFAISETQFVVFILNASRRLFSDRFFTSSFRPEFYTSLGVKWVNQNGPVAMTENGTPNGHVQPVSPFKRVLLRTVPELKTELANVVNVFGPWARDRGQYYSLEWKPRPGAESDPAFKQ